MSEWNRRVASDFSFQESSLTIQNRQIDGKNEVPRFLKMARESFFKHTDREQPFGERQVEENEWTSILKQSVRRWIETPSTSHITVDITIPQFFLNPLLNKMHYVDKKIPSRFFPETVEIVILWKLQIILPLTGGISGTAVGNHIECIALPLKRVTWNIKYNMLVTNWLFCDIQKKTDYDELIWPKITGICALSCQSRRNSRCHL